MNYRGSLAYLYGLAPRGIELGLGRVRDVLALRGHPERAFPCVLVAGTNGKGSVATMIATALRCAGLRVGLFTSPHLHRLVERFRVDGRPVSERALARQVSSLARLLERPGTPVLTFFEVSTVLAFELFREAGCDVTVLEVGLGGRLDATNVVTPLVSVITSIALDHTDRLGPTLAHVAREKAGIIKPGVPVVVGAREAQALGPMRARARRLKAPLWAIDRAFGVERRGSRLAVWLADGGSRQRGKGKSVPSWVDGLAVPLPGAFQADNVACAVAALQLLAPRFGLDAATIRRGLLRTRWPGRLELIPGAPSILCDAAHNPHACAALAHHLKHACGGFAKRVLLFGAMRDKDHARMLALLFPHVDAVLFTSVGMARAEPAHALAVRYGGEAIESPGRALERARKLAGKRGLVIACGSIFLMAEVRVRSLGLRADPPLAL